MTLTCLGTSDAFGSAGRHCAGYLVQTSGAEVLIDAGPSVLSALKGQGRDTGSIDAIALSHLHGDHFAGVPFLLLEYTYESPRSRPLTVVGPPGTERRVLELYRALYADVGNEPVPFALSFVELGEGGAYEIGDARIAAFSVPHVRSGLSLGFSLTSGGRALVYSGDTEWTPELLRHSRDADLFLCECSTFESPIPGHVSYREIRDNRSRFECGALLLTHLGREMRARTGEIAETLANDGLTVEVGAPPLRAHGALAR